MENKNALLTTAILSYVWLEQKMDNVDLLTPFVKYIIGKKYAIGEKIDFDYIIREMESKYAFRKLPLAILTKILNKMSKDDVKILKRDSHDYFLEKDLKDSILSFEIKERNTKSYIDEFINDLKKYLLKKQIIDENEDISFVEEAIMKFMKQNGFTILHDSDNVYKWDNTSNILNYNICKYLMEQFEKNSEQFQIFMKMIDGFMLSNVLYIQFENNINQNLNHVEVYLDAPLILRILGFKKSADNRMGIELLDLLKKQNAIIRCFKHNYSEVESIIENYKNKKFHHIQKQNNEINEQTLEFFDEENYSESEIDLILLDLEKKIISLGIQIVDTPNIPNNKDYNLGIKELTEYIQSKYKKKAKDLTIYNDILSVDAINIIRKGNKFTTIEKSKAVFVTLNYTFEHYVNEYLSLNNYNYVGLCINDAHLTALLWVKNNVDGNSLVRAKVLSSILAGFDLPKNMIEKVKGTLLKLEKYSPANVQEIVDKMITSQTSHALMEITGGDITKISEQSILDALQNDKNKEIKKHLEKINKTEEEIANLKENELKREKNKNLLIKKETSKIVFVINIILWLIYIIILGLLIWLFVYIVIIETNTISQSNFIKGIIYIGTFLGYFTIAYSVISLKRFKKIRIKFLDYCELKISYRKQKKYERI